MFWCATSVCTSADVALPAQLQVAKVCLYLAQLAAALLLAAFDLDASSAVKPSCSSFLQGNKLAVSNCSPLIMYLELSSVPLCIFQLLDTTFCFLP